MEKVKSGVQKTANDVLKSYAVAFGVDSKPLKAKIIDSPLGPLVLVSDEKSLLLLKSVDSKNLDSELKHLTEMFKKAIVEDDEAKPLKSIEAELDAYFKGELKEFRTSIDFNTNGTEFQRSVWNEINKIGYGSSRTYAELAQRIGNPRSFRAVANACGRNPIAIVVPCHRVLASGNGLGGYTGGIDKKIWLLNLENVKDFRR